ncbi:CNNM domain-containing protein [Shewanella livingstonensis]|uniref:HlyC/CorC family transporter n=1 Tax=Shewanella livingstonensis TaxID=150120 RepID=A0A3G8LUK7_9GAMM|nr:hemolysin family protein [Shewanella livingstonensis]AZG72592.1 HlyC/CorC family transporter [Shewanella livingstonensis]
MITLLFIVIAAISISFLCSVFESVLLSVTPSYIANLKQHHPHVAARLNKQKQNIDSPLVSILTLNTISHTMGASVAGAQAAIVFGSEMLGVFSAVLTFLILFLSEIIPKILGANYWRKLAPAVSICLYWMEKATLPLIWLSRKVTSVFGKGDTNLYIRQELSAMNQMGKDSGELSAQESQIITQMLAMKDMCVTDIMTPRTVIFKLPTTMTNEQFIEQHLSSPFTRFPVYLDERDNVVGYVNRNDIILQARQAPNTVIGDYLKPLLVVPSSVKVLPLFQTIIKRNGKMALVVDEYGSSEGIVTIEDIIETLIGLEIVDSKDLAPDMQALARKLWQRRIESKGLVIYNETETN